jgi:hypothetical protein
MRVLVAISILAFLALLWASIAIFQHIRRAQRRRRRSLESSDTNLSPTPPLPPPVFQGTGPQPMPRSDWTCFNKEMGDLSDPAPAGSRPKIRTANCD